MRDIFEHRQSFKPFEYPEAVKYMEAIQHSYWLHTKWNFKGDEQDFKTRTSEVEKTVLTRAILAISQIEVDVKKFWVNIGDRFPKPEIDNTGVIFGGWEVIHANAYSHLLEKLGLNESFQSLKNIPCIDKRIKYLNKALKKSKTKTNQEYTLTLALFSLFIENCSLFSQFFTVKAFNKKKNLFKDIDNVIQASAKEETIHSLFGVWLCNQVKEEHPEWFDETFYKELETAALEALEAEELIIDWMFEQGDLEFLSKKTVKEFIKDRFNQSLTMLGAKALFEVDQEELDKTEWFNEEMGLDTNVDFFYKNSTNYTKNAQSVTAGDLF